MTTTEYKTKHEKPLSDICRAIGVKTVSIAQLRGIVEYFRASLKLYKAGVVPYNEVFKESNLRTTRETVKGILPNRFWNLDPAREDELVGELMDLEAYWKRLAVAVEGHRAELRTYQKENPVPAGLPEIVKAVKQSLEV